MLLPSFFFLLILMNMSFEFGNVIFITLEMPGLSYSRPVDKIHISLQLRPSVIRGPCLSPLGWWSQLSKLLQNKRSRHKKYDSLTIVGL